jgi:catechol 2,3-dioxygenase-like lactoylglutathione lyase family enzyme
MYAHSSESRGLLAASRIHTRGGTPVVLRVSDLDASRKFYFDLLGFVPAEGYGYSDTRVVLVSPLLAHGFRSIVLTRERYGVMSNGLILELETSAELLDRYMLARLLGARTTPLMTHGRHLTVTITDPDGNELELRGHEKSARETSPNPTAPAISQTRRWGRTTERDSTPRSRHGRDSGEGSGPSEDGSLAWFDSYCSGKGESAA